MKTIQGVLIDPIDREIKRVEVEADRDGSYLESIYKLLDCGCVDVIRDALEWLPSSPKDDIWVDENMLDSPFACISPENGLFVYGKCLILSWDHLGECQSSTLLDDDIDALKNAVTFLCV